ncbi:MAG: VCBS repeat-containing protein [Pseudomonadota bacterium]
MFSQFDRLGPRSGIRVRCLGAVALILSLSVGRVHAAELPADATTTTGSTALVSAAYQEPTRRYAHGVLGDDVEWGALQLVADDCVGCETAALREVTMRLPESRVFEDLAPRLITLNAAGERAAMVVESDRDRGARLALYTEKGLFAATPYIGTRYRWLAPIGAADLDGDGALEIAYVDRPHLAKTLRVWQLDGNRLTEEANLPGVSNHRIGWAYIEGGLRDCGEGVEMILASGNWRQVVAVRYTGELSMRALAPYSAQAVAVAMACETS